MAQALRVSEITINATATTAQTLPHSLVAAQVLGVIQFVGSTTGVPTTLTVVSGTPAAGDVQFTGTPEAPSGTLTLSAAAAADTMFIVQYVAPGDVPAAQ